MCTQSTITPSDLPRPRIIYSAIFTWLALCGGRFTAPFLESEADFSDAQTGLALALQMGCCSFLAPLGGSFADSEERRVKHGRIRVMLFGVILGTTAFLLHGVGGYFGTYSTLWHIGLRLVFAVGMSLTTPVLDGLTLAYIRQANKWGQEDKANYGRERLHGAIWWAVANIIIGPFIDMWGFKVFYVSSVLSMAVCVICALKYMKGVDRFESRHAKIKNRPNSYNDIASLNQDNDARVSLLALLLTMCSTLYGASFLFSYFTLNMGASVVESLIFLFFGYLGGTNTLCGLTVIVTVVFEIPIFHIAPWMMKKLGPGMMQHIACAAYVVRVLGYSLIPQDRIFLVLFLEPLHGVTYACSQLSGVEFANRLMPEGYEASGQGLLSIFKGMGFLIGLSGGGWVEETLGPRVMYRGLASVVFFGMVFFGLAGCLESVLKRKIHVKDIDTIDEESNLVCDHSKRDNGEYRSIEG